MASPTPSQPETISIAPLLTRLAYPGTAGQDVGACEIAGAFALIFENRLSVTQMAAFLTLLHSTGKDRDPDVIVLCAERMRDAAEQVDKEELKRVLSKRCRKEGTYEGGFVCLLHHELIGIGVYLLLTSANSAISLEPEVTHTRPSTSRQHHQSSPRPCS